MIIFWRPNILIENRMSFHRTFLNSDILLNTYGFSKNINTFVHVPVPGIFLDA